MPACERFIVEEESVGRRLDVDLATRLPTLSRSALQHLIEDGHVLLNGKPAAKNIRLRQGDSLEVTLPPPVPAEAQPRELPITVVYEDDALLVVNKPKGMVVHPAAGHTDDTLVNALLFHCKDGLSGINGVMRPGIVHRIDKNTSGLLIVAKNDEAHQKLAEQIKVHSFLREYEAVVCGQLPKDEGTIDQPIGRSKTNRKKMCVTTEHSRNAVTHYQVLGRYRGFTHVRCRLETGRTHQIRVHFSHMGHPVAGDDVYGSYPALPKLGGQCLHARTIGFTHPITGEDLYFTSELPDYFADFLASLKKEIG